MKRIIILMVCLGLSGFLGCTNKIEKKPAGQSSKSPTEQMIDKQVIKGVVQLGLVDGATVRVFERTDTGGFVQIGETKTIQGEFSVAVPATTNKVLSFSAIGGRYKSEATGLMVDNSVPLSSVVYFESGKELNTAITPPATLVSSIANEALLRNPENAKEIIEKSQEKIAAYLGTSVEVIKAIPYKPEEVFSKDLQDPRTRSTLQIAAFEEMALRRKESPGVTVARLVTDLADGKIDGADHGVEMEKGVSNKADSVKLLSEIAIAESSLTKRSSDFRNLAPLFEKDPSEAAEAFEVAVAPKITVAVEVAAGPEIAVAPEVAVASEVVADPEVAVDPEALIAAEVAAVPLAPGPVPPGPIPPGPFPPGFIPPGPAMPGMPPWKTCTSPIGPKVCKYPFASPFPCYAGCMPGVDFNPLSPLPNCPFQADLNPLGPAATFCNGFPTCISITGKKCIKPSMGAMCYPGLGPPVNAPACGFGVDGDGLDDVTLLPLPGCPFQIDLNPAGPAANFCKN